MNLTFKCLGILYCFVFPEHHLLLHLLILSLSSFSLLSSLLKLNQFFSIFISPIHHPCSLLFLISPSRSHTHPIPPFFHHFSPLSTNLSVNIPVCIHLPGHHLSFRFVLSVMFASSCLSGERERPQRPQQGHGSSAD